MMRKAVPQALLQKWLRHPAVLVFCFVFVIPCTLLAQQPGGEQIAPEKLQEMMKKLMEQREGGEGVPPGLPEGMPDKKKKEELEKERKELEIIDRYRKLLYQKPFHQWAFDKLFRMFVEKNRVKKLVEDYEGLSSNNPEDDPYHVVLARLYEKTDNAKLAQKALERVKERTHEVLLLSARIFRKRRKFTQAAKALEEAAAGVQERRVLKEIFRELGLIYTASGDREKACAAWARIKALAPENYYNVKKLAELYKTHLYYDEALAEYHELLELAGGESARLAEAYRSIGEIQERKGDERKALEAYKKGIALMARGNWLRRELEKRLIALHRKGDRLAELEKEARGWVEANRQDPGTHEMLAAVYVAQKKLDEAAATLAQAAKLFPTDTVLSQNLRDVLARKGDTDALIAEYRRIIAENPQKTDLYIELGKVFASDKRFAEAKREWERALGKQMKDASLAARLAALYGQYKLTDEAVLMYNRAIELAPKERTHHVALGDLYMANKKTGKAIAAYKSMTQPDPQDPAAWSDLVAVLRANAFYSEALEAVDEALRLSPENYKYQFDKAGILLLLKKTKDAAALYRKVARSADDDHYRDESTRQVVDLAQRGKRLSALIKEESAGSDRVSRTICALAYERRMGYLEAAHLYRQILQEHPKARSVHESLARVLMRTQKYRDAQAVYERLLLLNPGKARSYYRALLNIMTAMGEEEEAAKLIGRMTDASPTNPAVYKEAGKAYLSLDRPQEALEAFRQATRLKTDDARLWILLADALVRIERDEEALEVLRKAVHVAKDSKKRFQVIGNIYDIYARLGRLEEEIENLKTQIDNNPYDTGLHLFLAELLSRNMEYAEAIDIVGRVLEIKKGQSALYEMMARLYAGMEDPKAEAQMYEQALAQPDADTKRLLERWGSSLAKAGQRSAAAYAFRQIPDTKKSVRLLIANELFDEAISVLREALPKVTTSKKRAEYQSLLSNVLWQKGQKQEAIEALLCALEIMPAEKEYLSKLADRYFETGNKEKAVEYAGKLFGAALREEEEKEDEEDEDEDEGYYGYPYSYRYRYGTSTPGLEAMRSACYFFMYRGLLDEFKSFCQQELERQPDNALLRLIAVEQMQEVSQCEDLLLQVTRELLRMEIDEKSLPIRYLLTGDVKDGVRFTFAHIYSRRPMLRGKEKQRIQQSRAAIEADAESLLELAIIYDIERKQQESLTVLKEAIELAPDVPIAVLAKARMHEAQANLQEAKEGYKKFLGILEEREKLSSKHRGYYRAMVKSRIPPELKNSVKPRMIEYVVDKAMTAAGQISSYGREFGRYSMALPGKLEIVRALARIEKLTGNEQGIKECLATVEPKDEKSPESAAALGTIYKEFDLEDDAARMYELEVRQHRYQEKLLGSLMYRMGYGFSRFGGYSPYGESYVDKLIEHYRKKEKYLEALDLALEMGADTKMLLGEHKLFEPGVKMYKERLAQWESGKELPPDKRDPDEYLKNVVRLATLLYSEKKYDEMESLYLSYLEKFPDELDFLSAYEVFLENKENYRRAAKVMEKVARLAKSQEEEQKRNPRVEPIRPSPPVVPLKESDRDSYDPFSGSMRRRFGSFGRGSGAAVSASEALMGLARVYAKASAARSSTALLSTDQKVEQENRRAALRAKAAATIKNYYVESRKVGGRYGWGYGSSDTLERFIERFGIEDEMVPVYRTVMILYPHDSETRMMYGKYLEKKGRDEDIKEAVKVYERVLKMSRSGYGYGWGRYGGSSDLTQRLNRLYRKIKKQVTSFEEIEKTARENPKNVKAALRLTVYYFLNGQIREAARAAQMSARIAPYNARLHRFLFHCLTLLGSQKSRKKAVEHLEAEIALAKTESEKRKLYTAYGGMLYFTGDEQKAVETWKKMALSDDATTNQYLGNLFMSLGKYELSADYLDKAAKRESGYYGWWSGGETFFRAVRARILAGGFDKALLSLMEHLEKGKLTSYYSAGGLPAVATCAEAVGKLAQLEEMLTEKVSENKDKVEWWKLMLSYYQSRGNERKVKEIWKKIAEVQPNKSEPIRNLYRIALGEATQKPRPKRASALSRFIKVFMLGRKLLLVEKEEQDSAFTARGRAADYLKEVQKSHHRRRGEIFTAMDKARSLANQKNVPPWLRRKLPEGFKGSAKWEPRAWAVTEYRKTLEPDKPETLAALARSLSGSGYEEEAIQVFEEYLKIAKAKTREDYSFYADLMLDVKRFDDALGALEAAVDVMQEGWSRRDYFEKMSKIHYSLGKLSEFIEKMHKRFTERPDDQDVHRVIFDTYRSLSDSDGAIAFARELVQREPAKKERVTKLAQLLMESDRCNEAIDVLKKLLETKPPDPRWIYEMLANTYFTVKDNDNALVWVKKYLERADEPDMEYAAELLVRELTKEAMEVLRPMWEERAEQPYYNMLVASAAYKLGDYKLAREACERAFLFEEWSAIGSDMGAKLRLVYDKTRADSKLEVEGSKLKDKDPSTLKKLFLYHLAANRHKAAAQVLERIVALEPYNRNFLEARLRLAHRLNDEDAKLDTALRLARLSRHGGESIGKKKLKDYLLTLSKERDPLEFVSLSQGYGYYHSRGGYNEYLGDLHFKKGNLDGALSWWKRLLYAKRDSYYYDESAVRRLAEIYVKHKLFSRARRILKTAEIFRSYYYYRRGSDMMQASLLRDEGKAEEAITKYLKILEEKYKGRSGYQYGYGYGYYGGDELFREFIALLRDEGRIDEFFELAKKKARDPHALSFMRPLYRQLIMEKRDKVAYEDYLALKHQDEPESQAALEEYLSFYRTTKNYARTLETGVKLLAELPRNRTSILLGLFVAAAKLGLNEDKKKYEQEYLRWNTVKEETRWKAIFSRAVAEELYADAHRYANKLLARDAEIKEEDKKFVVRYRGSLEKMYEKLGLQKEKAELEARGLQKEKEYLAKLDEKIKNNPFDTSAYYELYYYYIQNEDQEKALGYLEKIREVSGPTRDLHIKMAWRWFEKGEDAKALESFLEAEKLGKLFTGMPSLSSKAGSWPDRYHSRWAYRGGYYDDWRWRSPRGFRSYGRQSWMDWEDGGGRSGRGPSFSYNYGTSLEYGIALTSFAAGDVEKAKEYFRKARRNDPNSIPRLLADYVLDGKPVDWEIVKEVTGEDYEKYFERLRKSYEK